MNSLFASYSDVIGMLGVVITLFAYYLLNVNKLSSIDLSYLFMNFIGSSLVVVSLLYHWNLSALILEVAWALVSLLGVYRVLKNRNRVEENKEIFYKS